MASVSETIPEALQAEVEAALSWWNESQENPFEVTGILDADRALGESAPRELRLILCGGQTCQQQSFQVMPTATGFEVALAASAVDTFDSDAPTNLQAELDPPPGPRRGWLDRVLGQHKFVVLVFYRGFW